ncbi:MAG: hypothetical protein N3D71_11245 [Burkholderiaceae bacterium]|nr:hypothetical protein [Burkholderiaceae bacterium]
MATNDLDPSAVPPTREFTALWVAYGLHAIGFVPMLIWPAIIGVVINYAKRGDSGSLLDSHHRWLIRTFWLALLGYSFAIGIIVASAWPVDAAAIGSAVTPGRTLSIDWETLFATIGGATVGALGILAVWVWVIYRLVRGGLRLQEARPVR